MLLPAKGFHLSDCAVYNEPAYPAGPCDCGCSTTLSRYWTFLCLPVRNWVYGLRTRFRCREDAKSGLPRVNPRYVPRQGDVRR